MQEEPNLYLILTCVESRQLFIFEEFQWWWYSVNFEINSLNLFPLSDKVLIIWLKNYTHKNIERNAMDMNNFPLQEKVCAEHPLMSLYIES
jgi:hypothetical protein